MTVGGLEAKLNRAVSLPSKATSSSRMILITCSVGESLVSTSWPTAFSRMCSIKFLDDVEVDVGLKQGDANLAQCLADVFVRDGALAPKVLESSLKLIR